MSSIPTQTDVDELELLSGSSVTSNELPEDDFSEYEEHDDCVGMDRCIEGEKQCVYCNNKKSLCQCGDLGTVTSPSTTVELSSTNSSKTVELSSTNSSVEVIRDIIQIDGTNSNSSDSLKSEDGDRSRYNNQNRLMQSRFTRYCTFHVANCRCFDFYYKYPHLRRK